MESGGFRPQNRLFKLPSPPSSFQLEVQTLLLEGLMYCWEDVYLSSWEGPDFSFEEHTGQRVWKNPVDNGSPRRYENSTFERAIHYVFFKDPGRGGGRKAASKARSSWDRGRPLAPAYQLPKTHIQLESHKSCSKDYPWGRAMLSGLGSTHAETAKHPSAKITSLPLTCTMFKASSGRDAFIPHKNRKSQAEQKYPEVKTRLPPPLLQLWSVAIWRHDINDSPAHPEQSPSTSLDLLQAARSTAILHQPMSQMHLNILYLCDGHWWVQASTSASWNTLYFIAS